MQVLKTSEKPLFDASLTPTEVNNILQSVKNVLLPQSHTFIVPKPPFTTLHDISSAFLSFVYQKHQQNIFELELIRDQFLEIVEQQTTVQERNNSARKLSVLIQFYLELHILEKISPVTSVSPLKTPELTKMYINGVWQFTPLSDSQSPTIYSSDTDEEEFIDHESGGNDHHLERMHQFFYPSVFCKYPDSFIHSEDNQYAELCYNIVNTLQKGPKTIDELVTLTNDTKVNISHVIHVYKSIGIIRESVDNVGYFEWDAYQAKILPFITQYFHEVIKLRFSSRAMLHECTALTNQLSEKYAKQNKNVPKN